MHFLPAGLLMVGASFLSGVAQPPSSAFRSTASCNMVGRGDWSAHVNAMPGAATPPALIVTGTIGVKRAARTSLRLAPRPRPAGPPSYTVILEVRLPREPTIDMLERREVRGEWPVSGDVTAVQIHCGGRRIATIRDVVTAH